MKLGSELRHNKSDCLTLLSFLLLFLGLILEHTLNHHWIHTFQFPFS